MLGADVTSFSGYNFGIRRNEASQNIIIFVINVVNIVDTEIAIFFFLDWASLFFIIVHIFKMVYLLLLFLPQWGIGCENWMNCPWTHMSAGHNFVMDWHLQHPLDLAEHFLQ